jgi:lipopolysaccharide export system permease protein
VIINRYLIREIIKPLLAICTILVVIFASYSSSQFLADAVAGALSGQAILTLILLRTLIALEVLLPIALYLAVVAGLGRLYTDHEMTALTASGVSVIQVLRAVLKLSVVIALLVAALSLYARPWAYQESYWLEAQAQAEFTIANLEAGRFYEGLQDNRVIFMERLDRRHNRMKQVFVQSEQGNRSRVIYAQQAYQPPGGPEGLEILVFLNGHLYELDRNGGQDRIVRFQELTLQLGERSVTQVGYKRKAVPTAQLAHSDEPKDIAEFQWRLSTPVAAVLLSLLGVPLSQTAPRQGRYAKMLVAVLVYAVYYNLSAMAKTWVEQGEVGPLPGIWWVNGLLACVLLILLVCPVLRFRLRRK